MLKSFSRYLLISFCLAGTLSLVACGGSSSDPSNETNQTDDEQNQDDGQNQNDDQNQDDETDSDDDSDNNDDTQDDDQDDNQNDEETGPCTPDKQFYGQIKGSPTEDDSHGGGQPTTESLDFSAGLQNVIDKLKSAKSSESGDDSEDGSGSDSGSSNVSSSIDIQGALVTATSFGDRGNDWFWIQDQDQVVQVYLPESHPTLKSGESAVTIRVGMKLNFTATALKDYNGTPEIVGIENFEVASKDNSVPYHDILGGDSTVSDASWGELIRVGGTLENRRWCTRENGHRCYDITTSNGETITLRSNRFVSTPSDDSGDGSDGSSGDESGSDDGSGSDSDGSSEEEKATGGYFAGTCLTFVGPLGQFPGGPLSTDVDDPDMQLQETNYAWTKKSGGSNSDSGSSGSGQ